MLFRSYDYSQSPSQVTLINPTNVTGNFGSDALYGITTPYGGQGSLEQWKVHLQRQTCSAFQITMNEIFNPFYGTASGSGLTLSGLNLIVGIKKGYKPNGLGVSVG